jgi:cytidine deaminase
MSDQKADIEKAYQVALAARKNAHAPYSKFHVGAAVKLKGVPEPVPGCNVENASFGATFCAERTALVQAVARYGRPQPEFVIVVTAEEKATVPCALCLQVMAEFCPDGMPVILANTKGIQKEYKLKDLLPHPFRSFEAKPG